VREVLIWQLVDSAFPSGSFAHSFGLEAAWQAGEVTTDGELQQFVSDSLWQTGKAMLPVTTAVHRSPERLEELDALHDAFLSNAVANRASRVQGRALLMTGARVWPREIASIDAQCRTLCCHSAPVTGAVLAALGVPLDVTQRIMLFVNVRGILAAAVRLGIIGPYRAQRIQFECTGDVERVLHKCADLTEEDLAQTAPIIDVLQSAHDRLYSRLFQS